ncbi:MAG: methyl-accepting chemotaxis protein [Brevinemataceae bacterium]
MVFRIADFFQMMISNIKVRITVLVLLASVTIFTVFLVLFDSNKNLLIVVSRQYYASQLKLLISDLYIDSQSQNPMTTDREEMNARFTNLTQNNISTLVRKAYSDEDMTAVEQLNILEELVNLAFNAEGNSQELMLIYNRSLQYPTYPVTQHSTQLLSKTIARLAINSQIFLFTLVSVMLLLFIFFQLVAVSISKIQKATHVLLVDDILDISQRISLYSHDETGLIAENINTLLNFLETTVASSNLAIRKIIYQTGQMFKSSEIWKLEVQIMQQSTDRISKQIHYQITSVNQAAAALEQMERTLDIIFSNISRQSAAMTESAATLEEMGRQMEGVAKISSETVGLAGKLTQVANKGNQAVDASIISIRDVSEYSTQIIKLLKLITDIAKQTNLLAMNASIEAAHAGEAGRGFAIVAEEIRRLSETTNKNAKEIRTVVDTMVEKIENSVSQAQIAGEDLHQINIYAGNVEERIAQLNTMMQEQNTATHEMILTIEGLVNLAQEIKISMEEQQVGLHEYSNTIGVLRQNFSDTKSTLDGHMSSVDNLLSMLMDVTIRVQIKRELMDDILAFLEKFKFKESLLVSDKVVELEQNQIFTEYKNDIKISNAINDIMDK